MIDAASILKAASESWLTFDRIACRPFGLVAESINEPVLTLLIEIMCAPSMSQVAMEVAEHIGASAEDTEDDINAALEATMHVLLMVQRAAIKEQEQQKESAARAFSHSKPSTAKRSPLPSTSRRPPLGWPPEPPPSSKERTAIGPPSKEGGFRALKTMTFTTNKETRT